jgi:hypothetical protein
VDTSWLAGFIEGDGTITICQKGKHETEMCPHVIISNTNKELLTKIQANFGGAIRLTSNHKLRDTFNKCYQLEWRGRRAIELIKLIYAKLESKQAQASLLLNWEFFRPSKGFTLPVKEIQFRREALTRMRLLNYRGKI